MPSLMPAMRQSRPDCGPRCRQAIAEDKATAGRVAAETIGGRALMREMRENSARIMAQQARQCQQLARTLFVQTAPIDAAEAQEISRCPQLAQALVIRKVMRQTADELKAADCIEKIGWGGRSRTCEWRNQNPLPYHLATPHRCTHAAIIARSGGGFQREAAAVAEARPLREYGASASEIAARHCRGALTMRKMRVFRYL
jgi:hypothetical protein